MLVGEGPIWMKAVFIYSLFFLLLSAFMCIINLVWEAVKGPDDESDRIENRNLSASIKNDKNYSNINYHSVSNVDVDLDLSFKANDYSDF